MSSKGQFLNLRKTEKKKLILRTKSTQRLHTEVLEEEEEGNEEEEEDEEEEEEEEERINVLAYMS